ncbi:MAG: nitrilase-related carbon-nitrogen hydrolase, partial [Geminicoccaceae bacterium]
MASKLVITIAQANPTVGDIEGNLDLIRRQRAEAALANADLVVFSELMICGYPPEDLVLKPALLDHCRKAIQVLAEETADGGPALLVGTPWEDDGKLYNAVVLLRNGRIETARYKHDLPNYGVFDEKRVFDEGPIPGPIPFALGDGSQARLGVMICEDMWTEDVAEGLEESGAELLIVPNGSPFEHDKQDLRLNLAVARVTETGLPLVYGNQVGGQDELVFDGGSFVLNDDCGLAAQSPMFRPDLLITHWQRGDGERWICSSAERTPPLGELEAIYGAMCLGLKDYVGKNRFPGVVLGLSGGIDSALTAAVAADALGANHIHAVMMPSRYTSAESLDDAEACAKALGIRLDQVAIEPAVDAFAGMLAPVFEGLP